MKTDEVCGRPRHPFAVHTPMLGFYRGRGEITLADANLSIIALLWDGNPRQRMKNHPNCDQKMKNPRKMVVISYK